VRCPQRINSKTPLGTADSTAQPRIARIMRIGSTRGSRVVPRPRRTMFICPTKHPNDANWGCTHHWNHRNHADPQSRPSRPFQKSPVVARRNDPHARNVRSPSIIRVIRL